MELILIAFVGTLALMAGELHDLVRRPRTAVGTAPYPFAVPGELGRTVVNHSVAPVEESYDAAA